MHRDELLGAWSLQSCISRSSSGTEVFPMGDAPRGLLIYSDSGHMAAVLEKSGRPKFASDDLLRGTPEEVRQAFEGSTAYAGKFEFDEKTGTVTHHANVATYPNWEETDQVRFAKLVGGKLELTTPPIRAGGQTWVMSLQWRRAGA